MDFDFKIKYEHGRYNVYNSGTAKVKSCKTDYDGLIGKFLKVMETNGQDKIITINFDEEAKRELGEEKRIALEDLIKKHNYRIMAGAI